MRRLRSFSEFCARAGKLKDGNIYSPIVRSVPLDTCFDRSGWDSDSYYPRNQGPDAQASWHSLALLAVASFACSYGRALGAAKQRKLVSRHTAD